MFCDRNLKRRFCCIEDNDHWRLMYESRHLCVFLVWSRVAVCTVRLRNHLLFWSINWNTSTNQRQCFQDRTDGVGSSFKYNNYLGDSGNSGQFFRRHWRNSLSNISVLIDIFCCVKLVVCWIWKEVRIHYGMRNFAFSPCLLLVFWWFPTLFLFCGLFFSN